MPSRPSDPVGSFPLPTSLEFLRFQARRCGATGGLWHGGVRTSFGELAAAAQAGAEWLARRGLGRGSRVAVAMGNHPHLIAALYAIWGIGGVAVPIHARATAREIAALLSRTRAAGALCDPERAEGIREGAAAAGAAAWLWDRTRSPRLRALRPQPPGRAAQCAGGPRAQRPAVLAQTSGTTGTPKIAVLSHGNLFWSALACSLARGDGPGSVGVCTSPLSHVPVFVSHLLCRIWTGAAAVLLERFDVDELFAAIERHGITDVPLIGAMAFEVAQRRRAPRRVREVARKVSVGGTFTPVEVKQRLADLFPDAEIIEAYGQTEATDGVAMARGREALARPGTVGRQNPLVHVAIRRSDGTFAECAERGEIVVAGPTVMSGYYRDAAATARVIRGGWLHTGDLGHLDADGYLYVTGRAKDLVITGGENVSPSEVEGVLRRHPDVADVAVIGMPDPKWGEVVTAVVVPRPGARPDPAALAAFVGERLAGYKKPRRFEFVAALPRNAAGKVETAVLRERLQRATRGREWRTGDHWQAFASST